MQQRPVLVILCILCIHVNDGAFCKIPQATVLWVGRADREFEGRVRSVPEWPQEAQKRESTSPESHFVPSVLFVVVSFAKGSMYLDF